MKRPTNRDSEASLRTVSRRALVVGGVQLGVMGVLGWRMQQMQIDQADEYRLLAEENRINLRLIPPARGNIFDVNGVPLAVPSVGSVVLSIARFMPQPEGFSYSQRKW